jgi:hypothetical protein
MSCNGFHGDMTVLRCNPSAHVHGSLPETRSDILTGCRHPRYEHCGLAALLLLRSWCTAIHTVPTTNASK